MSVPDGSPYQPPAAPLGVPPAGEKPRSGGRNPALVLLLLLGFFLAVRLVNQWRNQNSLLKTAAEEEGQTVEEFLAANPEAVAWLATGRLWLGVGAAICVGFGACGVLAARYPVGARAAGILLLGTEAFCTLYFDAPYLSRAWWLQFLIAAVLLGGLLAERNRQSVAKIRKRLGYEPEEG